jgi:hypothetical protein
VQGVAHANRLLTKPAIPGVILLHNGFVWPERTLFSTPRVGRITGWCLSTTNKADLFAVWLALGNTVHGEPKKIIFLFEKSAVAFLAGLPMGFAWYINVWAPVGPPGGQRSDLSTFNPPCTWHGAVGRGCFGLGRPTENGGARCLASKEATSRLACRPKPGEGAPAGPKARPGPWPTARRNGRA